MHTILYKQHSSKQSHSQQSGAQPHASSGKSQGQQQHSSSSSSKQQQTQQQYLTTKSQAHSQSQPHHTSSKLPTTKSQLQQHELSLDKFLQVQQSSNIKAQQQQQQRKKISFENQLSNCPPPISSPKEGDKQALRIVRTIGQAFEVSHKLNSPGDLEEENGQRTTTESPNEGSESPQQKENSPGLTTHAMSKKPLISTMSSKQRPPPLQNTWAKQATDSPTEFKSHDHQVQLLKEQLEQEALNTQAAMGQLNLLREQLSTEMSARIEAENRNKQLLYHNKELLNHLHVLVQHIQELEGRPREFGQLPSTKGSTSGSPQNPSPGPHQPNLNPSSSLLLRSSLLELIESQLHRFYSPSLVVGNQHLDNASPSTPVHKSVKLPAELLKPPPTVPQVKSALISRSVSEKCHRELPQVERTSAWMRHTTK